jgi:hypothetical protein
MAEAKKQPVVDQAWVHNYPPHPWETYSDEKRAKLDQTLATAEGVKLYRSAGGIGIGAEYAPHSAKLGQSGGITAEEATLLARYRMHKLGMPNVPRGPRAPAPTPEQRAQMTADDEQGIERRHEAYFDGLVGKEPPPAAQQAAKPSGPTPQDIEAARRIVEQRASRVAAR